MSSCAVPAAKSESEPPEVKDSRGCRESHQGPLEDEP